jgi:hypothetical protein
MSRKAWMAVVVTLSILLAFFTQTLWRDLNFEPSVGARFAFNDSWGASAGTTGNCLAPSFGYARVVKVDRVWVTLEDAGAYYWTWTHLPGCNRFVRTRHWVRTNLRNQAQVEKRLMDLRNSNNPEELEDY